MAPPPGYAAYPPTNWRGGTSRVQPLATWILRAARRRRARGSVVSLLTIRPLVDDARRYLVVQDDADFDSAVGLNLVGTAVTGIPSVAIVVLTMIWLYRIAQNHARLGRSLRWASGWAIGGWFAPPCLYVIPTLMLQESWKAADPAVPPGSDRWKAGAQSAVIWIWFVVYSLVGNIGSTALNVVQAFKTKRIDQARFFVDHEALLYVQPVIAIAGCVSWFAVVRTLTRRHTQLTGESQGR